MSGRAIVPPFVIDAYRSARDSGTIWLLVIALVIAAPLTEEIVFRGFMYRGLAASRVGDGRRHSHPVRDLGGDACAI